MKFDRKDIGLLLVGAGPRLMVAGLLVALLWAAFFAVTGMPVPGFGDS